MVRRFDQKYYERYYRNPRTRVSSPGDTARLVNFVAAFLQHVQLPVKRVVDLGCGTGPWRKPLLQHFPRAGYIGVEISAFACEKYGWTHSSVVDFEANEPFDLVVCQGVLQYLDDGELRKAITNLDRLTRGVLYLEALTQEDWDNNCDQQRTDGSVHLRTGASYRRRLKRHFKNVGGGLFLSRSAPITLFELESLDT